jgi:hypothetical protein
MKYVLRRCMGALSAALAVGLSLKHGNAMKSALRKDQPLEWVFYPNEGHGWHALATNEDFWGRVERFLGKHIGAAAQPAP